MSMTSPSLAPRREWTIDDGGAVESAQLGYRISVTYQPILDVERGIAAGYQSQAHFEGPRELDMRAPALLDQDSDGLLTASAAATALTAFATLPQNTFVSIPIRCQVASSPHVRSVLNGHGDLGGIVLDITGFTPAAATPELDDALAAYRAAGALLSVGGHGAPQPELTSIVRLKPAIIRLGRDWVRGVDRSEAKRSAIEITGQLAGQLDAWILAEGVSTSAELRALAGLSVPLAQGSFIGEPQQVWPDIEHTARTSLPKPSEQADGVLRGLLQQAYTARDAASAAAVLPETSGFDALVIIDEHRRPTSILEQDGGGTWGASDVLAVNIDTPLADAVARAMSRPRITRFTPLVCTDNAGRFVGILRLERLMAHLAEDQA
jgi:EAL domain-containing protein (putative c-di-GMP-specific phosphodiesterase class I)